MINHKYVDINEIKLHFALDGDESKTVIIFLHGFPECWEMWTKQMEEFSKDFFVVAPDMRGYNLSSKPVDIDKYEMKYLMEDVRQLIEFLECKK